MKIMKENRESIYCKTQSDPNFFPGDNDDQPNAITSNTSGENLTIIQRTKDEDWKQIFKLYEKYIGLIVKK
jgi:hypothetical protein